MQRRFPLAKLTGYYFRDLDKIQYMKHKMYLLVPLLKVLAIL